MSGRVALFAAWAAVGVPLTYGSLYAFTPFGLAIIAPCLLAALALPAAGGSRWPEALGLPAGAGAFCLLMAASAEDPGVWSATGAGLIAAASAAYVLAGRALCAR